MPASILVADDEPNIVLSLEFILRQAGYRVRVAPDGEAALAAIGEEPPDLLVLDAMMPKRNGFDVCGTIRANPAWAGVRILMLTAKSGEEDRVNELAAYVDEKVDALRQRMPPGTPEVKLLVFASLLLADESREARGIAKQAENARASASDDAETLATALEDLITSRVDKMSKKVSGAA